MAKRTRTRGAAGPEFMVAMIVLVVIILVSVYFVNRGQEVGEELTTKEQLKFQYSICQGSLDRIGLSLRTNSISGRNAAETVLRCGVCIGKDAEGNVIYHLKPDVDGDGLAQYCDGNDDVEANDEKEGVQQERTYADQCSESGGTWRPSGGFSRCFRDGTNSEFP